MRVVHVGSAFEWRGGQSQLLLTATGMATRGHEVTVVCGPGSRLEARARRDGLRVAALRFGGDLAPRAILGLASLLRAHPPDVIHAHDPHATAAALLAARFVGGPRVVASRRVHLPLRGVLSRRKYAACDRLIAGSRAVARVLLEAGLGQDQIELVYEGVPDRPPQPGGREALAALGVPESAPVIGNVAALTAHKGHSTLLAAMPGVLAVLPEARLVVVGEGELRHRLVQDARAGGVAERCVFTGFRSDLDRLIPAFSLLCLTSRTEALGSSLLDAMAFGRPIVATATGGIPEAVADGETGVLVPVGDSGRLSHALVDLLSDSARREALGRAGRRRFERHFRADRMVDETLRVYQGLGLPSPRPDPAREPCVA
jgi:glycosyltransferase involved in cell wall biosynthesis